MEQNAVLIDKWLEWQRAAGLRPYSIRVRRYSLGVFARQFDLRTATADDVTAFIAGLPGGPASRHGHLASLRSFYRFAVPSHVAANPTTHLPSARVPRGYPRPVPMDAVHDALARASERTRFMLLLGAYAGLRRAEIAGLHSNNVSDTHLTITGKGGHTRLIPVHPILRPFLTFTGWAFPSRETGEHLTPGTVGEILGETLAPWTAHQLRHAFASRTYAACHDIRVVQELLGHQSVSTTQAYVATSDDAMRAAVLALA